MLLLSVTKSGLGIGTVVSNPPGIYCGTTCGTPTGVHFNTPIFNVLLSAIPDIGSVFVKWTSSNPIYNNITTSNISIIVPGGITQEVTMNAIFDIAIVPVPCAPLSISNDPNDFIITLNNPINIQLTATGGSGFYTFTSAPGEICPPPGCQGLPTGIIFDSPSGLFHGTPTAFPSTCNSTKYAIVITDTRTDCSTTVCIEFNSPCYQITECNTSPPIIHIVTDNLSQYIEQVIQIEDKCFTVQSSDTCIGSITMYPNGVPVLSVFQDCIHCNPLKCYHLTLCGDTNSPPYTITTSTDLSAYTGQVINYTDLNQSPPTTDCYIVSETFPCYESNPLHGTINGCFPDCSCCIPKSPPIPDPPYIPTPPEIDKHAYIVKEDDCDILANKKFANIMYSEYKFVYFGIGQCCSNNDIDKLWIKKELSDFKKLKDHE